MNNSSKHIDFLEQNVNDLAKYLGQLAQVEKEQANTMIDMSANLNEIGMSIFFNSIVLTN